MILDDAYKKIGAVLLPIFFIIDRAAKNIAISGKYIDIGIGEWLKFNFVSNKNIAFSIPITGKILNWFLVFIILALITYVIYLTKQKQQSEMLCLVAMILGASSNLYDRFVNGFVIDYIDLRYFTVFNIADAMIVVGVCLLMLITMKSPVGNSDSFQS